MKYKNSKTGVIIDVSSNINGGDWESLTGSKKKAKQTIPVKKEPVKEPETKDLPGITKAQIMQELDAFGVKYDPTAKKDVLYDLMMKGKE